MHADTVRAGKASSTAHLSPFPLAHIISWGTLKCKDPTPNFHQVWMLLAAASAATDHWLIPCECFFFSFPFAKVSLRHSASGSFCSSRTIRFCCNRPWIRLETLRALIPTVIFALEDKPKNITKCWLPKNVSSCSQCWQFRAQQINKARETGPWSNLLATTMTWGGL